MVFRGFLCSLVIGFSIANIVDIAGDLVKGILKYSLYSSSVGFLVYIYCSYYLFVVFVSCLLCLAIKMWGVNRFVLYELLTLGVFLTAAARVTLTK